MLSFLSLLMSYFLGFSLLYWVAALFINKNARMPQSCTGCSSTIALGLCIACLRCRDVFMYGLWQDFAHDRFYTYLVFLQ